MKSCIFILLYFQICFATSNTSSTSNTSNTSNTSSSNNAVDTITSSLEEGVHDRDRDHGNNHNDVTSSMDMDISMNMDMNMNMNDDIDDKCSNPNVNVNVHKNSNAQYSFKNQLIMALLKHKLQNPYDGNNDNNIDNGNDTHDYVTIGDDNDVNDDDGKYQSLLCWLYNLKLNIPDEHFSSGIFSVSIQDMVCSKFKIENISTSYNPSNYDDGNTLDPSFSFSINGVSATCSGRYKSGLTGGTVTVTVQTIENTSSVKTETTFQPYYMTKSNNNDYYNSNSNSKYTEKKIKAPYEGKITTCETNLEVPKSGGIIFSGSVSAHLIGLFASSIASHVTGVLEGEICPSIKVEVDSGWKKVLNTLDDYLQGLIHGNTRGKTHEKTHEYEHAHDSLSLQKKVPVYDYKESNNYDSQEIINWESDLLFWKQTLMSVNHFLSSHMNRGIIISLLDKLGWPNYNHISNNNNNNDADDTNDSECTSSTDCGLFFRGVNGMIRYMTDSGSVNITTISHSHIFTIEKLGIVTLTPNNIHIAGLDALTKIVISPNSDHSIYLDIESDKGFQVQGRMELKVDPTEGGMIQDGSLHETFDLVFNVSSISMQTQLDVAILKEKLEDISIGDIINPSLSQNASDNRSALLSSLVYANFTELRPQLHIDSFEFVPLFQDKSNIDTSLESSIDEMINNIIKLFLNEYDSLWTESLIAFGQGPVRTNVNHRLEQIISSAIPKDYKNNQPNMLIMSSDNDHHYFNFYTSSFVHKVHDFFASGSLISELNSFISCVASYLHNNKTFAKSNMMSSDNSSETFSVEIKDLLIENVDRINNIDIVKAVDEFHTISGISSHWKDYDIHNESNTTNDSSLLLGLLAAVKWPELDLNAVFDTSLSLGGLLSQIGTKIVYDLEAIEQESLYNTLKKPMMFLAPVSQESGFYNVISSIEAIDLDFNISASIGNDLRYFNYNSPNRTTLGSDVTSTLSTICIVIQDLLNTITHIGLSLNDEQSYEKILQNSNNLNRGYSVFWFVTVGIAFALCNIIYFYSYNGSKKRRLVNTMNEQSSQTCTVPLSLAFHQKISYMVRLIVPLIIIGTIVIFIVSNLSTGASVDIEVSTTNKGSISIPSVFTFSLGKTVSEMYQARVYTLMALVLIFSGIWPYVKLLLMLFAWSSNERWLIFERRERLLIWLDAFGKYSLVDSFVLVLMLVSFKFHFDLAGIGVIDSFVIPKDGFYTFLCATILSLVIGHTVTFLHRYSMMPTFLPNLQSERESLRNHVFERKHPHQQLVQLSQLGKWIWLSFNFLSMILLIVGAAQECFIFEFKGLAGLVLGDAREARYSLISLGTSLPLSVKDPSDIGIICIQLTYFFFALFMPIICIIIVNILFYLPMTLKNQNKVFLLMEICNAWSAIEVLILAVFASMLELSQFAAFMVGDHCDFLKGDLIKDLFHEDDTCFSVQSRLGLGSIYLCFGAFMQCFIMSISLRLCHQTIEERMEREGLLKSDRQKETDSFLFKILSIFLFQSTLSD